MAGPARPLLVLLPGLDGTGRLFEPLLAALPGDWAAQVVTYPPTVPMGYEALLPAVLAALPRDGPFVLVGESFGGPLALRAAVASPNPPQAVVLSASFIRSPTWAWPQLVQAFAPLASLAPALVRSLFLLGKDKNQNVNDLLRGIHGQVPMAVLQTRILELLRVDAADALAKCPCPVLYLRGRRDWIVPERELRRSQTILPGMAVAVLPTGHLVLQCAPTEALARIQDFLGKIQGH